MTSSFKRMRFGSNFGRAIPAPTRTSVPARFSCASADSWARPLPEHSSATSNGSSTMSNGIPGVTRSTGSTDRAPSFSHSARRLALGSLTTTSSTPRAFNAATERNPIGPPPVTSQRVPGRAPPACVMPCSATARGSVSAACLSERPSGTRSASAARTLLYSANAPCHAPSSPPTELRSMHNEVRFARQYSHLPHFGDGPPIARSPTAQPLTSAPRAATVPEYSCPSMTPARPPHSRRKWRSEPQIPQWLTSRSSSPGPGCGVGRSSTATSRRPMNTAAGMVSGRAVSGGCVMAEGSPEPDTHVNCTPPGRGRCARLACPTDVGVRLRGEP